MKTLDDGRHMIQVQGHRCHGIGDKCSWFLEKRFEKVTGDAMKTVVGNYYKGHWRITSPSDVIYAVMIRDNSWSFGYRSVEELRSRWSSGSHALDAFVPVEDLGPWNNGKIEPRPTKGHCYKVIGTKTGNCQGMTYYMVALEDGWTSGNASLKCQISANPSHKSHEFHEFKVLEDLGNWTELRSEPRDQNGWYAICLNPGETRYIKHEDGEWSGHGTLEYWQSGGTPNWGDKARYRSYDYFRKRKYVGASLPVRDEPKTRRAAGMYLYRNTCSWYAWHDGTRFYESDMSPERAYEHYQRSKGESENSKDFELRSTRIDWTPPGITSFSGAGEEVARVKVGGPGNSAKVPDAAVDRRLLLL